MVTGGTINAGNAAALAAESDLTTAYNTAAGLIRTSTLTGQNLGGMTLTPGVYFFASSAQLTGALTLNTLGNPNAVFVFQIGSTLTTASASSVIFTNSLSDSNVYWQVGSSATLGTGTTFEGNILALTSITLTTGATIGCGSALAINGAVTLDTNVIGGGCSSGSGGTGGGGTTTVPEPGTVGLLGAGLALLVGVGGRRLRI
jgi:type VI secretion system secreted protein VgrG